MSALDRLASDWMTVYHWNTRLYRRVLVSGVVLGFSLALALGFLAASIVWLVRS